MEERKRRPSRFQVTPAPDTLQRQLSENQLEPHQVTVKHNIWYSIANDLFQHTYTPNFGTQPRKSILKKTNSFTLKGFSPFMNTSPGNTPYTTVTGAESRIRSAFEAIFRCVYNHLASASTVKLILLVTGNPLICKTLIKRTVSKYWTVPEKCRKLYLPVLPQ